MAMLSTSSIRVAVDGGDSEGLLVLADQALVAVLVCLEEAFYEQERGRWHLEAGFGHCATRPLTFPALESALRWIAGRLSLDVDRAIAPALRQFRARSDEH